MIKRFRHRRIIVQSLLFTVIWGFVMYVVDYPMELWAGVGAIVYTTLYVARFIVTRINDFALQKTVTALGIEGLENLSTANQSFSWRPLTFIVGVQFFISVGYITMGVTVIVAHLIMRILDFPELPASYLYGNMVLMAVSLVSIIQFHVVLHATGYIARRKNEWRDLSLSLRHQFARSGFQVLRLLAFTPTDLKRASQSTQNA